jgi:hypothetical protein
MGYVPESLGALVTILLIGAIGVGVSAGLLAGCQALGIDPVTNMEKKCEQQGGTWDVVGYGPGGSKFGDEQYGCIYP